MLAYTIAEILREAYKSGALSLESKYIHHFAAKDKGQTWHKLVAKVKNN